MIFLYFLKECRILRFQFIKFTYIHNDILHYKRYYLYYINHYLGIDTWLAFQIATVDVPLHN